MTTNLLVPRLGEGVEEVTVSRWLKKVGDPIREMEALLEVTTDKVDSEIPSPAAGLLLQVLVEAGQVAHVGDTLAVIGTGSDPVPADQPLAPPISNRPSSRELGFISPVVARLAAEYALDLHQLTGSGLGGRITKNDVLAYLEHKPAAPSAAPEQPEVAPEALAPGDRLVGHSSMRKSIAEHMLASKRTAPHVLTVMEVDMSRAVAHRAANKAAFALDGANLTLTAYLMCAVVAGLKAHPLANSTWSESGQIIHSAINIGMAVSLGDEGLIVPVIKSASGLSLLGMARAVNDLALRARSKKLLPDEVRGGTFTLTNHGVSGSLFAMPIINQPQCGILGAGALQKRAVVVSDSSGNDAIAIRPLLYLSFVFDHRILDGASADGFLNTVKHTLEQWSS